MWDQHDMAGDAAMNLNNMNGYYFLSRNLDSGGRIESLSTTTVIVGVV